MTDERMSAAAVYLGDAVYARIERGDLTLTTGTHDPVSSDMEIVLDADVLAALLRYLTDHGMIGEVSDAE